MEAKVIRYTQVNETDVCKVLSIIKSMHSLNSYFSKLCHGSSVLNYKEFLVLYVDLVHFYFHDLIHNKKAELKDLKSFSNSFNLLYERILSFSPQNELFMCYEFEIRL